MPVATKSFSLDTTVLHNWQKDVIAAIEKHPELRESDQYQGIADYNINKELGIVARFPRSHGHTYLANYIAAKYPTLLVYGKMDHYKELTSRFALHSQTETVSMYELFYSIYKPSNIQPTSEFVEVKKKFANKKVVVVDNSSTISQDLCDLIYSNSEGIVVLLGH